MTTVIESSRLGPHRIDVVQTIDDDGEEAYLVVVDGVVLPDPLLRSRPRWEQVVRIYAQSQDRAGRR